MDPNGFRVLRSSAADKVILRRFLCSSGIAGNYFRYAPELLEDCFGAPEAPAGEHSRLRAFLIPDVDSGIRQIRHVGRISTLEIHG